MFFYLKGQEECILDSPHHLAQNIHTRLQAQLLNCAIRQNHLNINTFTRIFFFFEIIGLHINLKEKKTVKIQLTILMSIR